MIKKITKILSAFSLGFALLFTGCNNIIEEYNRQSSEYGTLIYGEQEGEYRALNVDSVKYAVLSVSGSGIDTPLKSDVVQVKNGRGSAKIDRIPVGKNRIITVQGYSDSGTTKVSDAVLRAVVDINSGVNNLPIVDWTTSRKGYIYNALLESGENIGSLSAAEIEAIDKATPDCDATNINLSLFVEDFKKGYSNLKESSAYILSVEKTLNRLIVEKAASSTESAPAFTATAHYSDGPNEDVTSSATWNSTETAVATVIGGKVTLVEAGKTVVSASYTFGGVTKTGAKQTVTVTAQGGTIDKVYLVPNSNWTQAGATFEAYMWNGATNNFVVMTKDGDKYVADCDRSKYTNIIFLRCDPSKAANSWNNVWNRAAEQTIPTDKDTFTIDEGQWGDSSDTGTGASGKWALKGSYSGGSLSAAINSEAVTDPVSPTVTITPASGDISLSGSIKVTFTDGNDTISSAKVTINGTSYDMGTTATTFTKSVKDLGITTGGTSIIVSATVTNGEGTATANATLTTADTPTVVDTFTWKNALIYFVIQDRFYDGDSSNNNSYGRMSKDDLGSSIGTFHGGDIKGLTEKLDYINGLGVNAIWITAPYEQAHGWCGGGSNGDFAHYAYHGYYPLDYTMMDKNMGTVEEFRTFVTECHKRGIRVVMDVVMNHTGYLTLQDCQDYGVDIFTSSYSGGKSTDMGFKIGSDGSTYHKHHDKIDYNGHNDGWAKWWGSSWIRAGVPGYTAGGTDDLTKNLDNLPDVKTESTTAQTVAPILQTKWGKESSGYDNWIIPAAKSLRSTSSTNAPVVWIEKWLAAWVEEFGIDGFRCDTAKHVDMYRWNELKNLCKTALANWRNSSRADEYAKGWDEDFWMTGEAFGWKKGDNSSWFNNGFDSMIDFTVAGTSGMKSYSPNLPKWENRLGDSQALLYISSHDTGLGRASNQTELGTSFVLMPGLVQIYYGDETARPFGDTGSDENQGTRSDFNWSASTGATAKHWGKVGTFRKFNPAVGAGTGSATKRSYSGSAGESKVAIGISGTSVDVSGLFSDGTTVYNWYDGSSATVSGGKVTSFAGGTTSQPILVSDKNPAVYGVTF